MDEQMQIAALWGSAENEAYSTQARLNFALAALQRMSKLVPGWEE
jgi:hypothetical protein